MTPSENLPSEDTYVLTKGQHRPSAHQRSQAVPCGAQRDVLDEGPQLHQIACPWPNLHVRPSVLTSKRYEGQQHETADAKNLWPDQSEQI